MEKDSQSLDDDDFFENPSTETLDYQESAVPEASTVGHKTMDAAYYEEKYGDLSDRYDDFSSYESIHRDSNPQEFTRRVNDRENLNYQNKNAMAKAESDRWMHTSFGEQTRKPGPVSADGVKRWEAKFKAEQEAAEFRSEQSEINHANRETASVYERSEHAFNFYKDKFEHHWDEIAPKYLTAGVIKAIERGNTEPLTSTLLREGFQTIEASSIEKRIDPKRILSTGTIDARSEAEEFAIDAEYSELNSEKERLEKRINRSFFKKNAEDISVDDLKKAEYSGSLYAIQTGARIDERTGDVVFSIPVHKGERICDFMKEVGVNFEESTEASMASYQGFANIIEAIKDKNKLTEKGFATLDWYFDNFHYEEHMEEFLGKMDIASEFADEAWAKKYDEYMLHRKEVDEYLQQQIEKPLPTVEEVERISTDQFFEDATNIMGMDDEEYKTAFAKVLSAPIVPSVLRVFPDIEQFPIINPGRPRQPGNTSNGPSSRLRLAELVRNCINIKTNMDPNLSICRAIFVNGKGTRIPYHVIEFQYKNSNIAIAAPLSTGQNAAYVWVGSQDTTAPTDWMDAFVQNPNPNMKSSKYQARQRSDVRAFNHIAALKQGRNAAQNVWFNMRDYINKVA